MDDGITVLPDGSAFCVASFDLPQDHWCYDKDHGPAPMPLRVGTDDPRRVKLAEKIREAGRYAYLATGMGDEDHDPDAYLQNLVCALLGFWTPDGLTGDDWDNPKHPGHLDEWGKGLDDRTT